VLVGCVRLQHTSAMVASLVKTLLFVLIGLGVMVAGLVLQFRGGARREEHRVEFLGWKFQFTSAGLVVFLIGALFFAVGALPIFVGVSPSPAPEHPPTLAPQGGVRPPVRTQEGEVEPNDYVTEATPIQIGATYAGAIDGDDKDFFAFEVGPGAQAPLLILRRVQGTGRLRVSVFDPHWKEARVGLLNDVLSEKIDVDEDGVYVLLLNAYGGDLRYELELRSN
jgi:hypothetical protein